MKSSAPNRFDQYRSRYRSIIDFQLFSWNPKGGPKENFEENNIFSNFLQMIRRSLLSIGHHCCDQYRFDPIDISIDHLSIFWKDRPICRFQVNPIRGMQWKHLQRWKIISHRAMSVSINITVSTVSQKWKHLHGIENEMCFGTVCKHGTVIRYCMWMWMCGGDMCRVHCLCWLFC